MELPDTPAEPKRSADPGNAGGYADALSPISEAAKDAPASEDDNTLDHRKLGQWGSRYSGGAWVQIGIEFGYLVVVLVSCAAILLWIGYQAGAAAPPGATAPLPSRAFSLLSVEFEYPRDRTFLLWLSVGLSGVVGGCCFALKWLYHSVAKDKWNRDRILWRLVVPALSGTVAVFVSMLVASGVLALIDARFFSNFYGAIGAGWLIGYFSDNVLAALQRLAHRWFGTIDEPKDNVGIKPLDQGPT